MSEIHKDDYRVCIWGTTVSKVEANRIGLALIIGMAGAVLSAFVFGAQGKMTSLIISLASAAVGYFGIAKRILKVKSKT